MKSANEIIEELVKSESSAAAVAFLGSDGMRQLLDARADDALEAAERKSKDIADDFLERASVATSDSGKYALSDKAVGALDCAIAIRAMKGGGK